MICRPLEKITNILVSNSVVRIAIVVIPVVVSSFYKKTPQVTVQVYIDILKNANITFSVIFYVVLYLLFVSKSHYV